MMYDVAVIGAGPAGAVFAAQLGQLRPDLRILVLDGQADIRRKVCGGLLAPDAQKVLAVLGLTLPNAVLSDPQIFAVDTLDLGTHLRRLYQRHYLNMDRRAFDRWLCDRIPPHVDVIRARCKEIAGDANGYILKTAEKDYHAASVVGADGAHSLVRRSLITNTAKQYTAIQEWYRIRHPAIPHYSCIFDPLTSDSCSWTICKDGYVIFGGAFEKKDCGQAFSKQKERLEAHLGCRFENAVKREACLVTSPRKWSDFCCGKSGVYLIGEAGGFISASSFEGISSAMLGGMHLADAFSAGMSHDNILRRYRKNTFSLRLKLWTKTVKRRVLCSPILRYWIMKSGVQSIAVGGMEEVFHEA
ncbi:MAG: FAD-binding protein [Clostridia bacterium]|nr:FAD-binding protein [Clostridia bacterium]